MSPVIDFPDPPTITTLIGELERIRDHRDHRGDLLVLVPAGDDPVPSYTAYDTEIIDVLYDGTRDWTPGFASGEPALEAVVIR